MLSVRVLLTMVIFVPTVVIAWLSAQSYADARSRSEDAARTVELVRLSSDLRLLGLWTGAEREVEPLHARLLAQGLDLRELDDIQFAGEDRDPVTVARELLAAEVATTLQHAQAAEYYGDYATAAASLFDELAVLYAEIDAGEIGGADVNQLFVEITAELDVLADEVDRSFSESSSAIALSSDAESLADLSEMLRASFEELYRSSSLLTRIPGAESADDELLAYASARARADEAEERFLAGADDELRARWEAYRADPVVREWEELREIAPIALGLIVSDEDVTLDPVRYGTVGFDQATLRTGLVRDLADRLAGDAQALRDSTEAAQRKALLRTALIMLGGVVLLVVTVTALVRPLARLRQRALGLSQGRLHGEDLGPIGPAEIAEVAISMDMMSDTLRRVDRELTAISEEQLDRPNDLDPIPGALGRSVRGSIGAVRALTARLRESEARALAVVSGAADGIVTVTVAGRILQANAAAERLLGATTEEVAGSLMTNHFHQDDRREVRELLNVAAAGTIARATLRLGDAGGLREMSLSVNRHGDSAEMTVILTDVSERLRLERELNHAAQTDGLTKLRNRTGTLTELRTAIDGAGRRSPANLLLVDLGRFHSVNDAQGHAVGDETLRDLADAITSVVDGRGTVGRIGGDEFAVVLPGIRLDEAVRAAEDIVRDARAVLAPRSAMVVVNVGVSSTTDPALPLSTLLMEADLALQEAKTRTSSVAVCNVELRAAAQRQRSLAERFRAAIGGPDLDLALQPIVDIDTGEVVCAEALARWTDDGVPVDPEEFITVAEKSSLIVEFDRWALARAADLAVEVAKALGRPVPVAVNISWRHLHEGDLLSDVEAALEATGCPPESLRLELTESVVPADGPAAQATLDAIAALGVSLALDDFGTGYTSINQLRRLPFDTVKIDRSLTADLQSRDQRDLVELVMQLGLLLDLVMVGEGVETAAQADLLNAAGCRLGQGWLWSHALPLDDFVAYAADDRAEVGRPVLQP